MDVNKIERAVGKRQFAIPPETIGYLESIRAFHP